MQLANLEVYKQKRMFQTKKIRKKIESSKNVRISPGLDQHPIGIRVNTTENKLHRIQKFFEDRKASWVHYALVKSISSLT